MVCVGYRVTPIFDVIDETVPLPQLGIVCWLCFDDQFRVQGE